MVTGERLRLMKRRENILHEIVNILKEFHSYFFDLLENSNATSDQSRYVKLADIGSDFLKLIEMTFRHVFLFLPNEKCCLIQQNHV